jgi:hypothetical protein
VAGFNVSSMVRLQRKLIVENYPPYSPFSTGAEESGPAEYWATGTNTAAPGHASWTLTTAFDDVGFADTTTGETAGGVGTTMSELIDNGSNISIAQWDQTKAYGQGRLTTTFFYWDGGAWVEMADQELTLWPVSIGFTYNSRTALFDPGPAARYFRCVTVADSAAAGALITSDSRVS